jgi:hypothetical protein
VSDFAYRMAGPILDSGDRVPWTPRPSSPIPLSAVSDVKGNASISPPARIVEENQDQRYVFPPEENRVVEQSPEAISQSQEELSCAKVQASSAPAELQLLTRQPGAGPSRAFKSLSFELNADAPYRAIRDDSDHPNPVSSGEGEDIQHAQDSALQTVAEELTKDPKEGLANKWGRPFRVNWIRTERLSFLRTKNLRNPWNHGREVKISRDGTELEPSIGQQLLEEWDKRSPSPTDIQATSSPLTRRGRGPKPT